MQVATPPSLLRFVGESPSAIAMFDRDMRYLAASERWATDYNLQPDLIGRSHYEVFPEITEAWKAIHGRALAGETTNETGEEFRRQDGSVQWLQWIVSPWFASDGDVGGIVISSFSAPTDTANLRPESRGGAGRPLGPPRSPEQRAIVRELRTANLILNHLSAAQFELLVDHLTPVDLIPDTVLVEPQQPVGVIYFPLAGLVSLIQHLEDGSSAEIAVGGRGGFTFPSIVVGGAMEETETRVLVRGTALAISADTLRHLMAAHPEIHATLLKFHAMVLAQLSVGLTCMARHSLDQRLARWLLTAIARMGEADLAVGQDSLALLLGVRRTGVSEAMSRLGTAGIVETGRRHIVIRDRARLEARSCECFHEAEAARRRSAPDIVISPPLPSGRLHELVDQFRNPAPFRRQGAM